MRNDTSARNDHVLLFRKLKKYPSAILQTLKVNGYTLRESNSVIFIAASLINWSTFKEKILLSLEQILSFKRHQLLKKKSFCCPMSKFFPLKVDPIFERLCPPSKQTGSHENCLPLKTWRKKNGGVPIHLNG